MLATTDIASSFCNGYSDNANKKTFVWSLFTIVLEVLGYNDYEEEYFVVNHETVLAISFS